MPSAMGNNGDPPEMSEERLLAPWYAAGKLDAAEIRALEKLAREDLEFAELVVEARREAAATIEVNEALGIPSPAIWKRLERSIAEEGRVRSASAAARRIGYARASISSFFEGFSKPQWQAAGPAALAICVIQAGAIVYLSRAHDQPSKYVTASGQKATLAASRPAFIVSFASSATIAEVTSALEDAGAIIVEGPNSDMIYHLALRDDTVAKDQAFNKLRSSAAVKLILPAK